MKTLLIISLTLLSGCLTTISVDPIKSWEGNYKSTNDFYNATADISLSEGESIWVLSNKTLNRVLKNVERR